MTEHRLQLARTPSGRSLRGVVSMASLGLALVLVPAAIGGREPVLTSGPLGTGGTVLALGHGSITIGLRPEVTRWYEAFHPGVVLPPDLTCALGGGSPD